MRTVRSGEHQPRVLGAVVETLFSICIASMHNTLCSLVFPRPPHSLALRCALPSPRTRSEGSSSSSPSINRKSW